MERHTNEWVERVTVRVRLWHGVRGRGRGRGRGRVGVRLGLGYG